MEENDLFSGLRVLDVGTWIAAPVAATILADFGADVIKVEMPGVGDAYRNLSKMPLFPQAEENYLWQMDARNKRSLTLNLKSEEGMQILKRLIRQCDVYITNHPLPMRRALGLTHEDLSRLNDRMIYASLTAYGEHGPDRDREGFDLVAYWARSGLMDLVRNDDTPPAQSLPGMGDHPSAVSLYASIVTALLAREKTGKGCHVHTSLLANGLWSASCIAQGGLAGGNLADYRRFKARPLFGRILYRAKDDRWMQFNMIRTQAEFEQLLTAVGLSSLLEDERFATADSRLANSELLVRLFQDLIGAKDSDHWLQIFAVENINATRMAVLEEVIEDEQIKLNDMLVAVADASANMPYVIKHPVNVDGVRQSSTKRAPDLGQHTAEILMELGYNRTAIDKLRSEGVV